MEKNGMKGKPKEGKSKKGKLKLRKRLYIQKSKQMKGFMNSL